MGLHDDHRKRVRQSFIEHGADHMAEHQRLEFILFYAIPRVDTNPIAHRLIARFGSFKDVLDAPYEELLEVEGIGENAATLIKLFASSARYYFIAEGKDAVRYDTLDKVGKFSIALFSGKTEEDAFMLLLDGKMEMIGVSKIGIGRVSSVLLSARMVIEDAIKKHAAGIVLVHNHPFGMALPSSDDIELTNQLEFLCHQLDVKLMEHIVVAGNDYCAIMRQVKTLK